VSVARCQEINARLRAAGFTVHEYPGCWSRGNGLSPAYEGGLVHHTATAFGMALPSTGIGRLLYSGRSDLAGPLCNWADNEDGSFTFIAAFPANHAGASGGRSMGPLPTTTLFNRRVLGLEIVYPGTVAMRDAQYRAAMAWTRVVTDVCGFSDIQRGRAHAETSITGKWDPGYAPGRTIDMTAFRAQAIQQRQQEDDMTGEEREWLRQIWEVVGKSYPPGMGVRINNIDARTAAMEAKQDALAHELSDDEANIVAALRALSAPGDVDEAAVAAALGPILAPLIQVGATPDQVEAVVRKVFASAAGTTA